MIGNNRENENNVYSSQLDFFFFLYAKKTSSYANFF